MYILILSIETGTTFTIRHNLYTLYTRFSPTSFFNLDSKGEIMKENKFLKSIKQMTEEAYLGRMKKNEEEANMEMKHKKEEDAMMEKHRNEKDEMMKKQMETDAPKHYKEDKKKMETEAPNHYKKGM